MALLNLHCKDCGTLGMFADTRGAVRTGWRKLPSGDSIERDWQCEYCAAEAKTEGQEWLITDRERDAMTQEAYDLETLARFSELRSRLFIAGKIADQEHTVVCAGETVVATAQQGMSVEAVVWALQTLPALPESWEAM